MGSWNRGERNLRLALELFGLWGHAGHSSGLHLLTLMGAARLSQQQTDTGGKETESPWPGQWQSWQGTRG